MFRHIGFQFAFESPDPATLDLEVETPFLFCPTVMNLELGFSPDRNMKHPLPSSLRRTLPGFARARQRLRSERIENVRAMVGEKLSAAGLRNKISPGARVAITAGSRGMGGFVELVQGIVDAVRVAGGKPFVIPAMGSHGGATGDGQKDLLKKLGVSESSVEAPVEATMHTMSLGRVQNGAAAHLDELAAAADGIIVLGRTMAHPENKEGIASGLLKMVTVGLGKQIGAQEAHSHGLWDSVKFVPELTMARSKILFGVSVVENAYRQPAIIEVVPSTYEAFRDADIRLLEASKPYAASIPFSQLDLLIVDELGKNISGTGMDLNVIGKWRVNGGKREPNYLRIVALSLTPQSGGNGLGIGLADFTTERFLREYDPLPTYINLLTACEPDAMNTREGPVPLALTNDREAIEVSLYSALPKAPPRICRIRSTARLDEFWISEALRSEIESNPQLELLEEPHPFEFNNAGNLF
jgi:hypothetical protein